MELGVLPNGLKKVPACRGITFQWKGGCKITTVYNGMALVLGCGHRDETRQPVNGCDIVNLFWNFWLAC